MSTKAHCRTLRPRSATSECTCLMPSFSGCLSESSDSEQESVPSSKQRRQSRRSKPKWKASDSTRQSLADNRTCRVPVSDSIDLSSFVLAESLRLQLQELRTQRLDSEKHCTELIRNLKITHAKITQSRKEGLTSVCHLPPLNVVRASRLARDLWKKKYYKEKKKSPPLEGQVTALNADLEARRQKILQTIEKGRNHSAESETRVRKHLRVCHQRHAVRLEPDSASNTY